MAERQLEPKERNSWLNHWATTTMNEQIEDPQIRKWSLEPKDIIAWTIEWDTLGSKFMKRTLNTTK